MVGKFVGAVLGAVSHSCAATDISSTRPPFSLTFTSRLVSSTNVPVIILLFLLKQPYNAIILLSPTTIPPIKVPEYIFTFAEFKTLILKPSSPFDPFPPSNLPPYIKASVPRACEPCTCKAFPPTPVDECPPMTDIPS